jgi:hypothetical protein
LWTFALVESVIERGGCFPSLAGGHLEIWRTVIQMCVWRQLELPSAKIIYMNAPDAPGFLALCIDRIGCSFICGLIAASYAAGPDEIR